MQSVIYQTLTLAFWPSQIVKVSQINWKMVDHPFSKHPQYPFRLGSCYMDQNSCSKGDTTKKWWSLMFCKMIGIKKKKMSSITWTWMNSIQKMYLLTGKWPDLLCQVSRLAVLQCTKEDTSTFFLGGFVKRYNPFSST